MRLRFLGLLTPVRGLRLSFLAHTVTGKWRLHQQISAFGLGRREPWRSSCTSLRCGASYGLRVPKTLELVPAIRAMNHAMGISDEGDTLAE